MRTSPIVLNISWFALGGLRIHSGFSTKLLMGLVVVEDNRRCSIKIWFIFLAILCVAGRFQGHPTLFFFRTRQFDQLKSRIFFMRSTLEIWLEFSHIDIDSSKTSASVVEINISFILFSSRTLKGKASSNLCYSPSPSETPSPNIGYLFQMKRLCTYCNCRMWITLSWIHPTKAMLVGCQ